MHVGCARWGNVVPEGSHLETMGEGSNEKRIKLCFFTPGRYTADDEDSKDSYGDEKSKTVAHCYCKAHGREIFINNPKNKKSKDINPGKAVKPTSDIRSQKKSLDHARRAEASFKRPGNKKKAPQKRKSPGADGTSSESGIESSSKKAKAEVMEENVMQFKVRGRSASALAGRRKEQMPTLMQRGDSATSTSSSQAKPSSVPVQSTNGLTGILKKGGQKSSQVFKQETDGDSGEVFKQETDDEAEGIKML